jgi:hypothetical protein
MGDSNVDGDGGRVDGDGSGGNSPSRQGTRPETPVPRTSSSMAAALRNFLWIILGSLGFSCQRLYIGGGAMSEGTRGAHTRWWRLVWPPWCPPPSLLWTPSHVGKNRRFGFHFVQFREYFLCNFSETQKQQKTGTGTVASC